MNIKPLLGGIMSDGSQAGRDTLQDAVYFLDETDVAIIENHTLKALKAGTVKLHIFVSGVHTELEIRVV